MISVLLQWLGILILFFIIEWIIFLRFFILPIKKHATHSENQHGAVRDSEELPTKLINRLAVVAFMSTLEELVFRTPILLTILYTENPLFVAWGVNIIMAIMFGLAHSGNSVEYSDGTIEKHTPSMIFHAALDGLLYGFLVILTRSLLPAIFLHILWNFSVELTNENIEYKLVKFAETLQKFPFSQKA